MKPVKVSIKNFQSINNLEFEVKGFTCITGKTNIGKSAIIRAIASAILNSPVSDKIRKGSKFCSVTLQSEDWEFKWEKGVGINRYYIPINSDNPLSNVGAGQIEPISKMGFQSVRLGRDESHPWYASQFDPLFLLTETGATVTDFISEVSRLQVLQNALIISNRAKKKASDESKVRASDLVSLREKMSKISDLAILEKVSGDLEEQANSIKDYENKIKSSEDYLHKLVTNRASIASTDPIVKLKLSQDATSETIKSLKSMGHHHNILMSSAQKVIALKGISQVKIPDSAADDIDKLHKMKRFVSIPFLKSMISITSGVEKIKIPDVKDETLNVGRLKIAAQFNKRIATLQNSVNLLSQDVGAQDSIPPLHDLLKMMSYSDTIESSKKAISDLSTQIQYFSDKVREIQTEIDKIPSCPTCGRVITGNETPHKSHSKTSV